MKRKAPAFTSEDRAFLDITAQLTGAALSHGEREGRLERVAEASLATAPELLCDTPPMAALRERLQRYAAARDTTVLIRGESGTDKELVDGARCQSAASRCARGDELFAAACRGSPGAVAYASRGL
jgi:DNA-binding NtrC family response regulator